MEEDKSHYLKLTLAAYRVTDRFPENEPLKAQIREKANNVLAGLIYVNPVFPPLLKKDLLKDIKVLDAYFELAENQNWVDARNFLVLGREYNKIKEKILSEIRAGEEDLSAFNIDRPVEIRLQQTDRQTEQKILPRQKKILELLKEKERIQVGELKRIFPDKSKRTLRRDLEFLLNRGLVKRIGDQRNTSYSL